MGLFRCKYCDKVFTSAFQSSKQNLCSECYKKLEDMYSRSKIHDYIRDHGLKKDFDPEELAREVGMNPKNIKILYSLGFFDRDIQSYSGTYNKERKKLADELRNAIEKIKKHETSEKSDKNNTPPPINKRRKFVTYGGGIYRR